MWCSMIQSLAGGVNINFDTEMKYSMLYCTDFKPFNVTVPTKKHKTWTITYNYTANRVVIRCNGVQVVNVVLSIFCNDSEFKTKWGSELAQIKFTPADNATKRYCVSSRPGIYNGCN